MRRFLDLTFEPFFVVTGIGAVLGAVNAAWPQWSAEKVLLIPFDQDYTIILQHWGVLLGVMGVFMIVVAFWEKWRNPILIFSACEKAFMVYLVARNISRPTRGAWGSARGWMPWWCCTPSLTSQRAAWGPRRTQAKDGIHRITTPEALNGANGNHRRGHRLGVFL
jgi:hypothetical protein